MWQTHPAAPSTYTLNTSLLETHDRREFEERMDKMKGEVQKIQEEKVHLMGLEQRLRQEFQTQVQAEQMSNEELRIRLETLQVGVAVGVSRCCYRCASRRRCRSVLLEVLPQVFL